VETAEGQVTKTRNRIHVEGIVHALYQRLGKPHVVLSITSLDANTKGSPSRNAIRRTQRLLSVKQRRRATFSGESASITPAGTMIGAEPGVVGNAIFTSTTVAMNL